MPYGYIDLGNGQLLVLDESTGIPYGVQNKYGTTPFGGTGTAGPTIENASGVAGAVGDVLKIGAATSGTWGSGSGVQGIAGLDASGNLVGDWIPRTGNLASLEALAGTQGELASAIDTPAIVQFTGTAGGAITFFPWTSSQSGSFAGSGAIAGTIPCTSSIIRVTIGVGATSFTGTLQNGYVDGQPLTVEFVSTPATLTALTVNGVQIAGASKALGSASITYATAIVCQFVWNATASAWALATAVANTKPLTDDPSAINIGTRNSATSLESGAIGNNCIASSYSAEGYAVGYSCITYAPGLALGISCDNFGTKGTAAGVGATNYADGGFCFGTDVANYGSNSFGLQGSPYGAFSFVLGSGFGNAYGYNAAHLLGASGNQTQAYTISSVSGTIASNPAVVLNTVAGLEVGQNITVSCAGPAGAALFYTSGTITAINTGTKTVSLSLTPPENPAITALSTTGFYLCQDGASSTSIGTYSVTHNLGEMGLASGAGSFVNPGDGQSFRAWLGTALANGATSGQATTDFTGSANTNLTYGNSNRYQLQQNQAVVIEATVLIKGTGVAHAYTAKRRVLASLGASGNTITVSSVQVIGTDVGIGSTTYTTTWVTTPPFSIAGNSTYGSVDVSFTGTMPEAGVMLVTFEVIAAAIS